jgi:hemolysin-activating ACP:hemolysin acyltransferase
MPLGQYLLRVEHSIDRARLVVVFDRYGQCAGYAHLAAVKPEFRGPVLKFGPQAVNSGALADEGDLFMLDFRAVPGMLPSFMSYLRDGPLKRESSVIYFRYKNNKRMAKRISRSDGSAFARKSEAIALADDPPFLLSHQACTFFLPTTQQFLWRMAALGELAQTLAHSPRFAQWPVGAAVQHLQSAVVLDQYKLYRDLHHRPVGALTWAWMPRQTPQANGRRGEALPADEWTGGECLTLHDVWADESGSAQLADDLTSGLFPGEDLQVLTRSASGPTVVHLDKAARKSFGRSEWMDLIRRASVADLAVAETP